MGGAGFRFGGPFASLRLQERGLPFALGLEDLRLLFPFRFQNFRLSHPFGLKDVRAFGTFGFHLGVHRGDKLRRRANVANFDSGDFHPPRVGGVVNDMQQAGVNAVALGEHFVQLH